MKHVMALISGLLFGLGLLASGMTDPAKVKGFLDLFGAWDPSLALVMGGAISVTAVAYAWARRRGKTLGEQTIHWPTATQIDGRLIAGGVLFGIGWALAGFCPGPALVSMGRGLAQAWWFGAAMVVGMVLQDRVFGKSAS
jgi:uncharacterized protein